MLVYLDDVREAPQGWTLVKTPREVIDLLKNEKVEMLSLDHDLGDDEKIGTGYDVLTWIEESVMLGIDSKTIPHGIPTILVHTANPVARKRMLPIANKLNRLKG